MNEFDSRYIAQAYEQAKKHATIRRLVFFLSEEEDKPINFQIIAQRLGDCLDIDDGVQRIPVKSILGCTENNPDYDADFNPMDDRVRPQWEIIAEQIVSGESTPPIEVRQIGSYYFVVAGSTYVSVCRYLSIASIHAHVTRIEMDDQIRDTSELRMLAI